MTAKKKRQKPAPETPEQRRIRELLDEPPSEYDL